MRISTNFADKKKKKLKCSFFYSKVILRDSMPAFNFVEMKCQYYYQIYNYKFNFIDLERRLASMEPRGFWRCGPCAGTSKIYMDT